MSWLKNIKEWRGHRLDSLRYLSTRDDQGETLISVREIKESLTDEISKPEKWGKRKGIAKKDRKEPD